MTFFYQFTVWSTSNTVDHIVLCLLSVTSSATMEKWAEQWVQHMFLSASVDSTGLRKTEDAPLW